MRKDIYQMTQSRPAVGKRMMWRRTGQTEGRWREREREDPRIREIRETAELAMKSKNEVFKHAEWINLGNSLKWYM